MNTGWQLCVVDYDRVKGQFSCFDAFLNKPNAYSPYLISDGSIVYFISHRLSSEYGKFVHPCKKFMDNINFPENYAVYIAEVYDITSSRYSWMFSSMLWPILTEKDIVSAELKFGISLKEYIGA